MKLYYLAALAIILFALSCTDPIMVGSDILGADRGRIGTINDLPLSTRVIRDDSLRVYQEDGNTPITIFTIGQIEDPVFGKTTHSAAFGITLRRGADGLAQVPAYVLSDDVQLDSVVLILPIDTSRAFYGPGRSFPVSLRELDSPLDLERDYFSNDVIPASGPDLAAEERVGLTAEERLLHDPAIDTTFQRAHMRIRMSEDFRQRLNDLPASAFESDTTFREAFPGVLLEPEGNTDVLVNVAPPALRQGQSPFSGFYFYYRDTSDMDPTFYRAPFQLWTPTFEYDYAGSFVEGLLEDGEDTDVIAVAGSAGLITEIRLDSLSPLEGLIVNRAELRFPLADVDGFDTTAYPIPTRLELFFRDNDGQLVSIDDRTELIRVNASPNSTETFLDGFRREGDEGVYYSPLLSIHLQRVIDGVRPRTLFLRVQPLRSNEFLVARALMSGPGASERPARLSVTFTELE